MVGSNQDSEITFMGLGLYGGIMGVEWITCSGERRTWDGKLKEEVLTPCLNAIILPTKSCDRCFKVIE